MPKNAVAVRTGPSPALVKTRNALEALQQKYLDYRKTKGEELKQARSVGMTDVVVLSGSSAVGAALAGTARGVGKRFDIDRRYIDAGTVVTGVFVSGISAFFDFLPGVVGGTSLMAPATSDFFEGIVSGEEDELDQ